MKKITFLFAIVCFSLSVFAQQDSTTLSKEATQEILNQVFKKDDNSSLKTASEAACTCLDSIETLNKGHEEISKEIADCIDKEVFMYQIMKQSMKALLDTGKSHNIYISDKKESSSYQKYYYEIERYLNDSCAMIRMLSAVQNDKKDNSMSKNKDALNYYYLGVEQHEKANYEEAIKQYKLALAIDEQFAFCWDNLALCYRKSENFDEAIKANLKSIEASPNAPTPYQNLAVVYEYKKDYQKASDAYKQLVKLDSKNPEGYYGLGRCLVNLNNLEEGLDAICKSYNLYIEQKSPYRTDAEKVINQIYHMMKGKEKKFNKIMKENNISPIEKD